jgi:hypothetical protein
MMSTFGDIGKNFSAQTTVKTPILSTKRLILFDFIGISHSSGPLFRLNHFISLSIYKGIQTFDSAISEFSVRLGH